MIEWLIEHGFISYSAVQLLLIIGWLIWDNKKCSTGRKKT